MITPSKTERELAIGDEATPYTNAVRAALATERAAVPALWPLEVANVLLMSERRKRSTQAKATQWLRFLTALPIAVDTPPPGLAFDSIIGLARSHKLTAYDAAYLELAMRLGVPLAAKDDALKNAAQAIVTEQSITRDSEPSNGCIANTPR